MNSSRADGGSRSVLVRADASTRLGAGHLMRSLTLAETMRNAGWRVTFATRALEGNLDSLVVGRSFNHVSLPSTQDAREGVGLVLDQFPENLVDLLVTDLYEGDADWHALLKPYSRRILAVDDLADRPLGCDLLLNQNLSADPARYRKLVPKGCRMLLGPGYALLRPQFRVARERAHVRTALRRVLIGFGGSDPGDGTGAVARAVLESGLSLDLDVLVGASYPHLEALERLVEGYEMGRVSIRRNVGDVAGLMLGADAAVGAGGSMSWERCCLGLPALLVVLAENQVGVVEGLARTGAGLSLGSLKELDVSQIVDTLRRLMNNPGELQGMSRQAYELADGLGAERVLAAIDRPWLREAVPGDTEMLWRWTNDPVTRHNSLNPSYVSWDEHVRWLKGRFAGDESELLVAQHWDGEIGQCRFDFRGDEAVVSISLASEFRGRGVSKSVLEESMECLRTRRPGVAVLVAYIKPPNAASLRLFESCGFVEVGSDVVGVRRYERRLGRLAGEEVGA